MILSSYLPNVWLIEVGFFILMTFLILFTVQKNETLCALTDSLSLPRLWALILCVLCSESFPFIVKRLSKCLGTNLRSVIMKRGTIIQCGDQTGNVKFRGPAGVPANTAPFLWRVLLSYGWWLAQGKAFLTLADVPVYQAVPEMTIFIQKLLVFKCWLKCFFWAA